jgi:hypothetical protein
MKHSKSSGEYSCLVELASPWYLLISLVVTASNCFAFFCHRFTDKK